MTYYDGDPFSNHVLNEIKCGECEREYDEQEGEGNICPTCKDKEEGESKVNRELEVLREEYKRAVEQPLFDNPQDYCILLDLISNRMQEIEEEESK